MQDRVTIQSFDWGTLMRWRQVMPRLPIVALTDGDFLQVGQPGASPWLGGIDARYGRRAVDGRRSRDDGDVDRLRRLRDRQKATTALSRGHAGAGNAA